ncbi:MAG: hypothetical protein CFH40_02505 [Alphaproteobacteria bacterium MarineAlpha10_Bin3]|nr:MAG: hypothetical protein CFH40_02505 [Alphaproteobacteria bacterium MarineAlpha10_Bin3]PPR66840.1 MAG: hypothetical protein CFH09_02505 [Alphaproteobacteria bacterium MarineAlpha4_Bin1]
MNLPDLPPQRPGDAIAAAIAAIEGHIADSDWKAAAAALAAIKPVIESGIAFVRDLPHLNLYSGLALACKMIGRQGDSRNHAARALITDPADLLGHALLPRPELTHVGRQLVHHQQFDVAKRIFDAALSISANEEYAFYADIFDYQKSLKAEAKQVKVSANSGRPTILNIVIWGDAFVAKFLRYTLPSLLAAQNLPALAASGDVTFDIHSTQADIAVLRQSCVVQAAERFATFTYTEIPERSLRFKRSESTPDPDRLCVSGAQYATAIKARHSGADLSFIDCGGLYANGFLRGAKHHLEDGYKAVAVMSPRASGRNVDAFVQDKKDRFAIEVDTAALVAYATGNLNKQLLNSFMRPNGPPVYQDPLAALFKIPAGFIVHSFQFDMAMIANDFLPDDLAFDFHTADGRFLAELCDGRDPGPLIKVIANPDREFAVINLDSGEDGTERAFAEIPVTPESCAESALKWCAKKTDLSYFDWAFRQRFEFPMDDAMAVLPGGGMAGDETVERILGEFAAGRDRVDRRIDFLNGDFVTTTVDLV